MEPGTSVGMDDDGEVTQQNANKIKITDNGPAQD